MRAGRVVLILLGALIGSLAFGLVVAGAGLAYAWSADRTADGYFEAPEVQLETEFYAIVSPDIDLGSRPGDWFPSGRLADVRIAVEQPEAGALFVGIGPSDEVDAYFDGVGVSEVSRVVDNTVRYRSIEGDAAPAPPADQGFWVATNADGTADSFAWELTQGEWTLVIMNADASPGFATDAVAAANVAIVPIVAAGLALVGAVLGAVAIALLIAGVTVSDARTSTETMPTAAGLHPVRVEGVLDAHLSRGLWLVKWFLAIPHFIVLAFLWTAAVFLTVAAGFAILFTGRYPRGIFDFNVGVLRWSWRVSYYATSAIGTDRYPPFTLEQDHYPATFDVAYPESLSRGLVLVKWLLAIPHLIIVSLFTNGLIWWTQELGDSSASGQYGTGLIGLLVLVAGIALLFTGRYPQALFDLLMGLNRWVYRVVAYVGLMTDQYPPFRLDQGGSEPPATPGPSRDPEHTGAVTTAGM